MSYQVLECKEMTTPSFGLCCRVAAFEKPTNLAFRGSKCQHLLNTFLSTSPTKYSSGNMHKTIPQMKISLGMSIVDSR